MHQYNVRALSRGLHSKLLGHSRRTTGETDISWSPWITSRSDPKYTSSQTKVASTMADALVTHFFCGFGVPKNLQSDQVSNFESSLMHGVLERLCFYETRTTRLHTPSEGMVVRYVKIIAEYPRRVISTHQPDCDERLPSSCLSTGHQPTRPTEEHLPAFC